MGTSDDYGTNSGGFAIEGDGSRVVAANQLPLAEVSPRHIADPEVIHCSIQGIRWSLSGQFPTVAAEEIQAPELICPTCCTVTRSRGVGKWIRNSGRRGRRKLAVLRRSRYDGSSRVRAIDPRPVVVTAIDDDARNIGGHHTFVIPQGATLILCAGPVENRDLKLVVEGLGRGKSKWAVPRNDQRISQNVLENKTVIRNLPVAWRYTRDSHHCTAHAIRHRRAGNRNRGNVRRRHAAASAGRNRACLRRVAWLRGNRNRVGASRRNQLLEGERRISSGCGNRQSLQNRAIGILQREASSHQPRHRSADCKGCNAIHHHRRDVGGSPCRFHRSPCKVHWDSWAARLQ